MRWEKKGISEVIVTIAIALLTIGAVALIVAFVVPFVRDNLNSSTECIDYQDYFTFYEDFGYNCYVGDSYALSVKAGNLEDDKVKKLKGFKFEFKSNSGESVPIDVFDGEQTGEVRMLNSSLIKLEIPEPRGVKTYVYNDTIRFSKVRVYPVLTSGRLCEDNYDELNLEGVICTKALEA